MNKSTIATILGAALLGIAKSKKTSFGSLGLKKNRSLDAIDQWLSSVKSQMYQEMEDSSFFEYLDWDEDKISLLENIKRFSDIVHASTKAPYNYRNQVQNKEELNSIENCSNCPEAWFYYSIYAAIAFDMGEKMDSFDPKLPSSLSFDDKIGIYYSFHKNKPNIAKQIRDTNIDSLTSCINYMEMCLEQIKSLKKESGINEETRSENILLNLQGFINEIKDLTSKPSIHFAPSILGTSIVGYCFIQILRFQISVPSDKNLSEITKEAFKKLLSKNALTSYYRGGGGTDYGFKEIPMGGLSLFSMADTYFSSWGTLNYIHMPVLKKMNYINRYSLSIMDRITHTLTPEQIEELVTLFSKKGIFFNRKSGVQSEDKKPLDLTTDLIRSLESNNISNLAIRMFLDVSTIIYNEQVIFFKMYDSVIDFLGMLSSLENEAEDMGIDFYPSESWNHDYNNYQKHILFKILNENNWSNFLIGSLKDYFEFINTFNNHYSETEYSDLQEAVDHYFDAELEASQRDWEEAQNDANPVKFLEYRISLSPQDKILSQLPLDEVLDEPRIKRILLVEYRNPKTLTNITNNTQGRLCVGNQSMRYLKSLTDGSQRHFGILAQTENGLSVMYHTHYVGDNITSSQFTNHNNSEGYGNSKGEHTDTLEIARSILDQQVKRQK